MPHLFAYGTLMCQDIMLKVSRQAITGEHANLQHFSCRSVKQQPYPGLIESVGEVVSGLLYRDISSEAWVILDRFEGEMYKRCSVSVQLASGNSIKAFAYVVVPSYIDQVTDSVWDFDEFIANGREHFEANFAGFKVI